MAPTKVVIADDHTLFREGVKKMLSLEKDILVVGEAARGDEVANRRARQAGRFASGSQDA